MQGGWAHWIVFMTSLYMYYAPCFVLVEHYVCHEQISVLINIFMLLEAFLKKAYKVNLLHIYIYIYILYIYIYII